MESSRFLSVVLLVAVLLITTPPIGASGGSVTFKTDDLVSILQGDTISGSITVVNPSEINFTAVVYRGYSVSPRLCLLFSPKYVMFRDWGARGSQVIHFTLNVSSNAPPGRYTLLLKFRGITLEGDLYDIYINVPVRVTDTPVLLKDVEFSVKGRTRGPSNPFKGETLIVSLNLENIGKYPEGIIEDINFTHLETGRVIHSVSKHLVLTPGESEVSSEVPISWSWPDGTYNVSVVVKTTRGLDQMWKTIDVSSGVGHLNLSVDKSPVMRGDDVKGYLSIFSERSLDVQVVWNVTQGEKVIARGVLPLTLDPGPNVFSLNLPTNVSGSLRFGGALVYGNFTLSVASVEYTVLGFPAIQEVNATPAGGEKVSINVSLFNPNDIPVQVILYYNLSDGSHLLYSDVDQVLLKPGSTVKTFEFSVPRNITLNYLFKLSTLSGMELDEGSGSVRVPPTMHTSTSLNITTNTTGGGGASPLGSVGIWVVLLAVGIVVVLLAMKGSGKEHSYVSPWERARKPRTRPRPKRKSPLGRFKRPKLPKFIENRELPRRFKRNKGSKKRKSKL